MFINRIKELNALNEEYNKPNATFSVVYGRRRVGKTALLSEFIKDKEHLYLYITQSDLASQVESFIQQIKKFVDDSMKDYIKFDGSVKYSVSKLELKL